MLKIRAEQLEAYSQAEVDRFEDWMTNHLKRFFPRECKTLGDSGLKETIQFGSGERQVMESEPNAMYVSTLT